MVSLNFNPVNHRRVERKDKNKNLKINKSILHFYLQTAGVAAYIYDVGARKALYLSVSGISSKVLIDDTIFYDRHFKWSSEPPEG